MSSVLPGPQRSAGSPVLAGGNRPTPSSEGLSSEVTVTDCGRALVASGPSLTAPITVVSRATGTAIVLTTDCDSQSMADKGPSLPLACCAMAGTGPKSASVKAAVRKPLAAIQGHRLADFLRRWRQIAQIGIARQARKAQNHQHQQKFQYASHARPAFS